MNSKDYQLLSRRAWRHKTISKQAATLSKCLKLRWFDVVNIEPDSKPFSHFIHDFLNPHNIDFLIRHYAPWLPAEGDPIFLLLVFLILTSETPFSRAAKAGREINPLTLSIVKHELEKLETLARTGTRQIFTIKAHDDGSKQYDFDGTSLCDEPVERRLLPEFQRLCDLFATREPWCSRTSELENWHRKWGYGEALYRYVFSCDTSYSSDFSLKPLEDCAIPHPSDFIGYEDERETVRKNTQRFIDGLPAQDILLYGDRGTGKSSTVRLMLHEFAAQGLRMVTATTDTKTLKDLYLYVRKQPWKFILFIDDISFDGYTTTALDFRSLLQRDAQERPSNIIFYVTSNRRTIVRTETSDTSSLTSQTDAEDKQEILALSDRFGLKVWFQTPSQGEYLNIVHGLARQHKIDLPIEELEKQAILWERWNNVRSPRTAQQFVRSLINDPS